MPLKGQGRHKGSELFGPGPETSISEISEQPKTAPYWVDPTILAQNSPKVPPATVAKGDPEPSLGSAANAVLGWATKVPFLQIAKETPMDSIGKADEVPLPHIVPLLLIF